MTQPAEATVKINVHLHEPLNSPHRILTEAPCGPFAAIDIVRNVTVISGDPQAFRDLATAFGKCADKLATALGHTDHLRHDYRCGECGFRIIDDSDEDPQGYFEAVDEHVALHRAIGEVSA